MSAVSAWAGCRSLRNWINPCGDGSVTRTGKPDIWGIFLWDIFPTTFCQLVQDLTYQQCYVVFFNCHVCLLECTLLNILARLDTIE